MKWNFFMCLFCYIQVFSQSSLINVEVNTFENYLNKPVTDIDFEYNYNLLNPVLKKNDTSYFKVNYTLKYKNSSSDNWSKLEKETVFYRVKSKFELSVIDKFQVHLLPGKYSFEVTIYDLSISDQFSTTISKDIKSSATEFISSDFVLSHKIDPSEINISYVKNKFLIIPNIKQQYNSEERNQLKWYIEFYNVNENHDLEVFVDLYQNLKLVKHLKHKIYKKPPRDLYETGMSQLDSKIKNGFYNIHFKVSNGENERVFNKKIQIKNSELKYKNEDDEELYQVLIGQSPLDLDNEFKNLGIITKDIFKEFYLECETYEDKVKFIIKFWNHHKNGGLDILNARNKFLRLVDYVRHNKRFRDEYDINGKIFRNDIIFLILNYGFPERISKEKISNIEQSKILLNSDFSDRGQNGFGGLNSEIPYEIWSFRIDNKLEKFFLAKKQQHMRESPRILHSTIENSDFYNPRWKKSLITEYRQF